jgi:hypothetical protein
MSAYCEYGKHTVENVSSKWELYFYTDKAHGIMKDVATCRECLYKHQVKYYPGGPNMRHLLRMYPELAALDIPAK